MSLLTKIIVNIRSFYQIRNCFLQLNTLSIENKNSDKIFKVNQLSFQPTINSLAMENVRQTAIRLAIIRNDYSLTQRAVAELYENYFEKSVCISILRVGLLEIIRKKHQRYLPTAWPRSPAPIPALSPLFVYCYSSFFFWSEIKSIRNPRSPAQ